MTATWHSDGP